MSFGGEVFFFNFYLMKYFFKASESEGDRDI